MNIREIFPGIIGYSNLTDDISRVSTDMEYAVSSGLIQWHETVSAPDGDVENIGVNHEVRRGLNFGLHPNLKEGPLDDLFKLSDFLYKAAEPAVAEYKSRYYSYDAVDYFGWVVLKYRVFPSNYLFLHAAKKVTAGVKYAAINFIN